MSAFLPAQLTSAAIAGRRWPVGSPRRLAGADPITGCRTVRFRTDETVPVLCHFVRYRCRQQGSRLARHCVGVLRHGPAVPRGVSLRNVVACKRRRDSDGPFLGGTRKVVLHSYRPECYQDPTRSAACSHSAPPPCRAFRDQLRAYEDVSHGGPASCGRFSTRPQSDCRSFGPL